MITRSDEVAMSFDKKTFMKTVTVIYDTREQQNKHIIDKLGECGIMTEKESSISAIIRLWQRAGTFPCLVL